MKIWVYALLINFLFSNGLIAKTLEQKKLDLKKALEAGAITKIEYKKAQEYLDSPDKKNQEDKPKKKLKIKKKKKKKNTLKNFFKKDDEEEITLKKIEELGEIVKFDNTYYPNTMLKKLGKGCHAFKCQGENAGKFLFQTFNRSKSYSKKNPGKMIKAMAMFEVFYSSKLWYAKKSIERYRTDDYKGVKSMFKNQDENEIRSLISTNKGRKSMREALGMSLETPSEEAIKKFWLLGEFLDLGTGVKNKKLAKDLKERREKLANYKSQVVNLRKKLQDDLGEDQDEKPVE